MDKTLSVRLPNGRQVTFTYPYSQFMEAVCTSVFNGKEYPSMPFLEMKTIVDVGANIGCTALLFAALYPAATIYALEPASEAFGYLQRNTANIRSIRNFHMGVYDKDATPTMHLGAQASVTNSIAANAMTGPRQETITLRRFSAFIQEQVAALYPFGFQRCRQQRFGNGRQLIFFSGCQHELTFRVQQQY